MKKVLVVLTALFAVSMALTTPLNLAVAKGGDQLVRTITTPITSPISSGITGVIQLVSSPLANIRVILFKTFPRESKVAETTTDSNGYYSFQSLPNGVYKVMPKDRIYSFNPAYKVVTLTGGNTTVINFQAEN